MNAPFALTAGEGALPLVTSRFAVPGMRCAGCIAKIERGLATEDGVVAARVDFTAHSVAVSHLAGVEPPALVAALDRIGFAAHPLVDAGEADVAEDAAHRELLSALAVAAFGAMNIMLLSVSVWSGLAGSGRTLFHWLSAAIALPVVLWAGRPFYRSAFAALRRGTTNMDVPITIGVTLTTAMSLYETVTHGPHAWFDGAVMLLFFLLGGRALDSLMRRKARDGAQALMQASAAGAHVIDGQGRAVWRDAALICPGDVMLVAAGERIAADGLVREGVARVDASMLTGESAPVDVPAGGSVLAGMLNLDAPVRVEAVAVGDDRAIAGLARAMRDAAQSKSRYVRIADRASRFYAPAVHGLAALSFAGWMIAGAGVHQSLLIAVAVLLITCPCALGLAVPVAQVVVAGALMKQGILVKDGSAIERLAECDRVVLDKTGTVTLGRPQPQSLDALDAGTRGIALALAQASRHPLSKGLAEALREAGTVPTMLDAVSEEPGFGVRAMAGGVAVALGRPTGQRQGGQGAALTIGDAPPVFIAMDDALRPDAVAAVGRMRAQGLDLLLLSGDNHGAVEAMANRLGVPAVAGAQPDDKLALIRRLTGAGHRPLMVGDGLNDGPALAAAHASIAPSSASDVGQQAADMLFMGDSLNAVPRAIAAARATQRVVRGNFILAIGYNAIAVPLAIGGWVTPLIAAVAMSLSSLIVIGNSLRLAGAAR